MNQANPVAVLDGVTRVVAEALRFKAKLAIGENAYSSLRMINRIREGLIPNFAPNGRMDMRLENVDNYFSASSVKCSKKR